MASKQRTSFSGSPAIRAPKKRFLHPGSAGSDASRSVMSRSDYIDIRRQFVDRRERGINTAKLSLGAWYIQKEIVSAFQIKKNIK